MVDIHRIWSLPVICTFLSIAWINYELVLPLNQISYLKKHRIPFVRRAENKCLTANIALHLTASDASAFYPLVRRFNLYQQETPGCTGMFIVRGKAGSLIPTTTSNTKTSLGIIRDGISRYCPENVKALFTLLDAVGTFTPLDQFKKCGQIFSEQYLSIPLPAQCKIGRSNSLRSSSWRTSTGGYPSWASHTKSGPNQLGNWAIQTANHTCNFLIIAMN